MFTCRLGVSFIEVCKLSNFYCNPVWIYHCSGSVQHASSALYPRRRSRATQAVSTNAHSPPAFFRDFFHPIVQYNLNCYFIILFVVLI